VWWIKDRSANHCDEQGNHNYNTVSIDCTPNGPIRRDAGGAYSSSRGIPAVQYERVAHAAVS
jgi:hypothetical protein